MTATGPSNFGPLTTIFNPPTWCFNERWVAHNTEKNGTLLRYGATCDSGSIGFASDCYPTGWTGSNASALSYKGFSPGLACPYGFTGAASASHIERSDHFVLSEYITDLGEHDLATACCPKNYDYNGHWCISKTLSFSSSRSLLTTSGSQCVQKTAYNYFQSIGSDRPTGLATFQAYPVIIVQDSRSSTSLERFPSQTDTPGSSDSSGLATGAKIAIGVCIPVGIIIIAAIVFIWWHRRRARAKKAQDAAEIPVTSSQDPDPYMGKPELDGGALMKNPYEKQELDAQDSVVSGTMVPPAELPALQSDVPSELPSHKSPDTPQAELPGDLGAVPKKEDHENRLRAEYEGGGGGNEVRKDGESDVSQESRNA